MEEKLKISNVVEAEVTRITDFGAFVKIEGENIGLIHISQISDKFVKDINEHLKVGQRIKARIIRLGPGKKIDLSLKGPFSLPVQRNNSSFASRQISLTPQQKGKQSGFKSSDLEEKLKKFLQESRKSLADLKRHKEKHY